MSRQSFGQAQRVSCPDRTFYVATKFGLEQDISCRDRVFYVVTEFGQDQWLFLSRQGIFISSCRERIVFAAIEFYPRPKGFLQ